MKIEYLTSSEFDFIKSNSDLFKKHLYEYYNFIGKKITHISIKIEFPKDFLICIKLHTKYNDYDWFTINNSSNTNPILYIHRIKNPRYRDEEPKNIKEIKSSYKDELIKHLIQQIKRDNHLKEILQ